MVSSALQEDTVETLQGMCLSRDQKYCPNRLIAVDSLGRTASIVALIKTQGSDTKLVAQNQPYHEARSFDGRQVTLPLPADPSARDGSTSAGAVGVAVRRVSIPPVVAQIADGENGGVMMNEFPRDFAAPWRAIRDDGAGGVCGMTGSEYLAAVAAAGVTSDDFPACQAAGQYKLRCAADKADAESTGSAISSPRTRTDALARSLGMEGVSWTNNLSWVRGYDSVLGDMRALSVAFHARFDRPLVEAAGGAAHLLTASQGAAARPSSSKGYRDALLLLLLSQTSCFRYWGDGPWTAAARELCARGQRVLQESAT
jgi:hypothetical protein